MFRWAALIAANYVLWLCMSQINYCLAPYQVYLSIPGLFITLAALRMTLSRGLVCSLITGLMLDAFEPVPFGTHMLILGAAHSVIYSIRTRFPRDELSFKILTALFANAIVYAGLSLLLLRHHSSPLASLARLSADLFFSELFIVALAPWFLSLQAQSLELAGVNLYAEERGIL